MAFPRAERPSLPLLPPGIHRLYMVPRGLHTFPVVAMYLTLGYFLFLNLVYFVLAFVGWRAVDGYVSCYPNAGLPNPLSPTGFASTASS